MTTKKANKLRVLELGDSGVFYRLFPGSTTWVWGENSCLDRGALPEMKFSLRLALHLRRRIVAGDFDLILLGEIGTGLWRPDHSWFRNGWTLTKILLGKFSALAPYLVLFLRDHPPIAIIDPTDGPLIGPQYFPFFSRVDCFFKRELPQNHWETFLYTSDRNEDVTNIERQPLLREAERKLRPFPVTTFAEFPACPDVTAAQKTTDIFYAGKNRSTVRTSGLKLLHRLRDEGVRVDISEEKISPEEFRERLSRSWLAWSPQGQGWDCFRHYEALVHGAVPVMNYPKIERYKPLLEGEHAFYYGCEDDDLIRVVKRALLDKNRLQEMAEAGRAHLRQWHTGDAIRDYIWKEISGRKSIVPDEK